MKANVSRRRGANNLARHVMAIICALLMIPGKAPLLARQAQQPAEEGVRIPADQVDALVAPIALYPDPLLSQTLAASTYPLELMQLRQWLEKNKNLKDKALVDAVSKQPWDPSVGVAMGAAWGGGWGWGVGWGHNDIDINRNNSFNRNTNISGNRNTWQHNPQHRGGAPYANRATANRFGSNARGDSLASRQKGTQQQIARQKGSPGSLSSRSAVGAGGGTFGGRSGTGGADRIGSRSVSSFSGGDRGGFGAGSSGFSGKAARSSSSRGASSLGGAGRSGGGFGGGRARGGGRR